MAITLDAVMSVGQARSMMPVGDTHPHTRVPDRLTIVVIVIDRCMFDADGGDHVAETVAQLDDAMGSTGIMVCVGGQTIGALWELVAVDTILTHEASASMKVTIGLEEWKPPSDFVTFTAGGVTHRRRRSE